MQPTNAIKRIRCFKPVTLFSSFKSFAFRLWDEQHRKLGEFSPREEPSTAVETTATPVSEQNNMIHRPTRFPDLTCCEKVQAHRGAARPGGNMTWPIRKSFGGRRTGDALKPRLAERGAVGTAGADAD
jgi:hypothetical protein